MKVLVLGLALSFLVVACGGDDDEGATPSARPTSASGTGTATSIPATAEPTATAAPATPTPVAFDGGTDPVVAVRGPETMATLVDVRVGSHPGFDRIVFEFADGVVPGYRVSYEDEVVACGSGEAVELAGLATLTVELRLATAHTDGGESTIGAANVNLGGGAITEAKSTCDFEAVVVWAIGTTAERPFRVYELTEPARLVIDIISGGIR